MSGARWNQISVKYFHASILGRFAQICTVVYLVIGKKGGAPVNWSAYSDPC